MSLIVHFDKKGGQVLIKGWLMKPRMHCSCRLCIVQYEANFMLTENKQAFYVFLALIKLIQCIEL